MFPAQAEQKQLEIYKRKSGQARFKIALNLSRLTRKIMEAGIRSQYPTASKKEFKQQVAMRTR